MADSYFIPASDVPRARALLTAAEAAGYGDADNSAIITAFE